MPTVSWTLFCIVAEFLVNCYCLLCFHRLFCFSVMKLEIWCYYEVGGKRSTNILRSLIVWLLFLQRQKWWDIWEVFTINVLSRFNTTVNLACIFKLPLRVRWLMVQSCDEKDCQNQHYCKYLFVCLFLLVYVFVFLGIICQVVNQHKKPRERKRQTMKQLVRLVTLAVVSAIIILDCPTLESHDRLWSDYISGHLDKNAKRYLLTAEMKKRLNLETVSLKTTITKENYFNCRKALMELSSTSSGQFKQSVWEVQLYCTWRVKLCLSVSTVYNLQAVLYNDNKYIMNRHLYSAIYTMLYGASQF